MLVLRACGTALFFAGRPWWRAYWGFNGLSLRHVVSDQRPGCGKEPEAVGVLGPRHTLTMSTAVGSAVTVTTNLSAFCADWFRACEKKGAGLVRQGMGC